MEETGTREKIVEILMKIYQMPEKPENAINFVWRELCDESYPSDEEIEDLKNQLKELLVDKENRILAEKFKVQETHKSADEIQKILNEKFTKFQLDETGKSLLKKYLKEDLFNNLRELTTNFDGSLLDNIQSGLTIYEQEIGVFASDENSYEIFADLFDPILSELHDFHEEPKVEVKSEVKDEVIVKQEKVEEIVDVKDLDPEKLFIKSLSFTINRSISEIPFLCIASGDEMNDVVETVTEILSTIQDEDLKGDYKDYSGIPEEQKMSMIEEGILFKDPDDEILKAAETFRFWPRSRGIFVNTSNTIRLWINEQEHITLTSYGNSGDMKTIYDRLKKFMKYFDDVEFAKSEKWGFLSHNLKLIGNGIKISVDMKIPQLLKEENKEKLETFLDKKFFDCVDIGHGVMRLSTKRRMGISEQNLVSTFQTMISELITAEKCSYQQ